MIRIAQIHPHGNWQGRATDQVTLDREDRHRRRAVLTCDHGLTVLLDEPTAIHLRHGDGLELEDGRFVEVLAEPEDLVEIEAANAAHLVKIAWHLGNRHLPTQLLDDRVRIRRDHVIEDMVLKLGGKLTPVAAPFDPEGGAYGHGQTHSHDHGPGHGHHHHAHKHAHD
ncbi:urease accessory protein UreE [uncultured Roseibium sp.]|uniref:urease accessory protein UreE n=1 Tax=uncultured Roseibium sp. TaxID=1936171 RepID=UPI002630A383|nr:urease accessory protein UreE [uncultured Roseibium sp.]